MRRLLALIATGALMAVFAVPVLATETPYGLEVSQTCETNTVSWDASPGRALAIQQQDGDFFTEVFMDTAGSTDFPFGEFDFAVINIEGDAFVEDELSGLDGTYLQPEDCDDDDTKDISAKALDDHECDSSEWHFVITQIDSEELAPDSIDVEFSGGDTVTVPLDKFTGKTAHYTEVSHLDETVVSATASIYSEWGGQFNLSHGPCEEPETTTTTQPEETTTTQPEETTTTQPEETTTTQPEETTTTQPEETTTTQPEETTTTESKATSTSAPTPDGGEKQSNTLPMMLLSLGGVAALAATYGFSRRQKATQ